MPNQARSALTCTATSASDPPYSAATYPLAAAVGLVTKRQRPAETARPHRGALRLSPLLGPPNGPHASIEHPPTNQIRERKQATTPYLPIPAIVAYLFLAPPLLLLMFFDNNTYIITIDDAILTEILTTGYAGYQIRTEEDLKAHDSII